MPTSPLPRRSSTRRRTLFGISLTVVSIASLASLVAAGNDDLGAIDRAAGGAGVAPAVRAAAPTQSVPTTAAPATVTSSVVQVADGDPPVPPIITNRSSCRTAPTAAAMTLSIPAISYKCPVYAGGQDVLDAGEIQLVPLPALGKALASHPGQSGTLWIAGHRSSHGAPFAAVPDLADGALILVSDTTSTATYVVVGRARVEVRDDRVVDASGNATGAATVDAILRADRGGNGAARLLLQTCDGSDARWMIYADLVTT
ncbi:MAG: Sortase domain [Ilumatobacteraceae bacterium]|nr:Sortase domain [Ilumatobacteraceae bacterium]